MTHKNLEGNSNSFAKVPSEVSKKSEGMQSPQQLVSEIKNQILEQDSLPYSSDPNCHSLVSPAAIGRNSSPIELPAGKNYFRVREVASIVGVGAHVLRFWETEFSMVRPTKSRSGQRVYRRKDVEALDRIRQLLHVDGLSIKSAREKLLQERRENAASPKLPAKRTSFDHNEQRPSVLSSRTNSKDSSTGLKELLVDLRQLIKMCRQDPFSFSPH